MKAKLYTTKVCPYCWKAKRLLEENNIKYEEIVLDSREELDKLKKKTGHMTVPQISIDGKFIGGSDDLEKWLEKKPKKKKSKKKKAEKEKKN
jgi:glutaredoxin